MKKLKMVVIGFLLVPIHFGLAPDATVGTQSKVEMKSPTFVQDPTTDIWISGSELASLPTSSPAWDQLKQQQTKK